ncbi:MAG: hypothetical protein IK141_06770 [Clostridia bacterium]|nr:hypothetical protein [Clostridia bacterium]
MRTVGELSVGDVVYIGVRFSNYNESTQSWYDTDYQATPFYVVHHGKPSSIYDDSFLGCTILQGRSSAWHSIGPFSLTDATGNAGKVDYSGTQAHQNGCAVNGVANMGCFGGRIDPKIQAVLQTVRIPYRVGTSGRTVASGSSGLAAKVFLPSMAEVSRGVRSTYGSTYNFYVQEGALFDYWRQVQAGTAQLTYADWRGHHTEAVLEDDEYSGDDVTEAWCLRTPLESSSSKLFYTVSTSGAAVSQTYASPENYSNPCIVVSDDLFVDDNGMLRAGNEPVIHGKVSGVWKKSVPACRIGGVWKQAEEICCKKDGVWKAQ